MAAAPARSPRQRAAGKVGDAHGEQQRHRHRKDAVKLAHGPVAFQREDRLAAVRAPCDSR